MQSWLHAVPMWCSLPANPCSHQHVGPLAVQEEWPSNERRNSFSLVIVIVTEVSFIDSALANYRRLPWQPGLILSVPHISVLDQHLSCLLQHSCFLSYFAICSPMGAGGFLYWICWLTSHIPSSFPSDTALQMWSCSLVAERHLSMLRDNCDTRFWYQKEETSLMWLLVTVIPPFK